MSGGAFEYKQHAIDDIVENIESRLDTALVDHGPLIAGHMHNALFFLRAAKVYAQRLDWYFSGDDGPESFMERLAEELAAVSANPTLANKPKG